jgi:hypothetical protein
MPVDHFDLLACSSSLRPRYLWLLAFLASDAAGYITGQTCRSAAV